MPNEAAASELSNGEVIRRLLKLAWHFRGGCVRILLLQLILLTITLSGLGLTGLGIDYIHHRVAEGVPAPPWPFGLAPPAGWPPMAVLFTIAGIIVLIAMVRAVLDYLANYEMAKVLQAGIVVDLRAQLYNKIQRLSFRFFDANASGTLINRMAGDIQSVRLFVDGVLLQSLQMAIALALYLVYMLNIHKGLTFACLGTVPVMVYIAVRFSRTVRPAYRESLDLMDRLILRLSETVRGIHVVKGFAREEEEWAAWGERNRAVRDQKKNIFFLNSLFGPGMELLANVNLVVLLGYGGWLYLNGRIPLGTGLIVFVGLLQRFSGQVGMLTNITNSMQQSLASARRVFEILDTPMEIHTRPGARPLPRLRGDIRFEKVSFAFEPGKPVLQGIDLAVPAGRCLGITGGTGSGKSTLLSLVPRFYDPTGGRVLIDGLDVRDADLDDLRRRIGLVFQQSFLFSNTVAANIAFGNPRAGREEIERAARIASAHEFILQLPDGYDTVLGESGADLSGGQRQRLAIARAVLTDPAVLLLDDPTAAVDARTEHEILQALDGAMRGRTTFMVTHRISTLQRADIILVLEDGRPIQYGTHDDLIRVPGPYRHAARLQVDDDRLGEPAAPEGRAP